LPNRHFHKDWQERVKVTLDQPAKKLKRRLARKAKAQAIAPRPVAGLLRPAVRCPTRQYNTKVRAGRGFSLAELKEAGIPRKLARTIGIAVDHRRDNKSTESLQRNVERLKEYKSKLVVFPRKSGKVKAGDATPEQTKDVTQLKGAIMPIVQEKPEVGRMDITDDMKHKAVIALKFAKARQHFEGISRWKKDDEDEEDK